MLLGLSAGVYSAAQAGSTDLLQGVQVIAYQLCTGLAIVYHQWSGSCLGHQCRRMLLGPTAGDIFVCTAASWLDCLTQSVHDACWCLPMMMAQHQMAKLGNQLSKAYQETPAAHLQDRDSGSRLALLQSR